MQPSRHGLPGPWGPLIYGRPRARRRTDTPGNRRISATAFMSRAQSRRPSPNQSNVESRDALLLALLEQPVGKYDPDSGSVVLDGPYQRFAASRQRPSARMTRLRARRRPPHRPSGAFQGIEQPPGLLVEVSCCRREVWQA